MDPRAEPAVPTALLRGQRPADRITILISRRPAGVTECDRIFVCRDGRITKEGDRTSLMARGSAYAEMLTQQAAAYRSRSAADAPDTRP